MLSVVPDQNCGRASVQIRINWTPHETHEKLIGSMCGTQLALGTATHGVCIAAWHSLHDIRWGELPRGTESHGLAMPFNASVWVDGFSSQGESWGWRKWGLGEMGGWLVHQFVWHWTDLTGLGFSKGL